MNTARAVLANIVCVAPLMCVGGCGEQAPPAARLPVAPNAEIEEMVRTRSLPAPPAGVGATLGLFRGPDGAAPGEEGVELRRERIGELVVKTGRLCACDAFVMVGEQPPFVRKAPMGRFPVELTIARYVKSTDERIALAAIVFSDAPVAAWETAVHITTDPQKLEYCAYGVDAGTGCFYDDGASEFFRDESTGREFSERLVEEMEKTYKHTRNWAVIATDLEMNLAAFSSGMGDGAYMTYWGLDAEGNPVCLVTDFGVLGEE